MKSVHYPVENGEMVINGEKMTWRIKRSKSESAFGIRGSRIFWMEMRRDGELIGEYDRGWTRKIRNEEESGQLCLEYILGRFGKNTPKKKKVEGFQE